jgi:DNA (cytosine-5)-methyltransferase 1
VSAYYNEIDPYCAAWLRNLIAGGLIAPGDVDERSIVDVRADDLREYTQCHFFAGLGGWSLALRLALWPDDRPVWTGSCPCQPFSAAGKGKASGDERHLWPEWLRLIRACRPATIFGEQVEAAIGWGWLDLIHSDLEPEGYTVGAAVLPACCIGAPHRRNRLWFSAVTNGEGLARPHQAGTSQLSRQAREWWGDITEALGNNSFAKWASRQADDCKPLVLADAHGVSARVAKLRAAGNAIVPQVAAEFIKATGKNEE